MGNLLFENVLPLIISLGESDWEFDWDFEAGNVEWYIRESRLDPGS
jgi:hypothetical protein